MSNYTVLARKYRPRTFAEVVGQGDVVAALCGALESKRLGHAFLFCGPRGTGKTTMARILARALNCEKPSGVEPCCACRACESVEQDRAPDVLEIDGASHTGVDQARELGQNVGYAPLELRHRVTIIDEVHMLSKGAFNALLKVIEEPPAHVTFIFATTEPERVPETVRSRCQVHSFRALQADDIEATLERIAGEEQRPLGGGTAALLAKRARGSLRDGLTLLDMVLAAVPGEPQPSDVEALSGAGSLAQGEALADAVLDGDRAAVLAAIEEAVAQGSGEEEVLGGLIESARRSLHLAATGSDPWDGATEAGQARARAERLGAAGAEAWLETLLAARGRMRGLPLLARAHLEVACLRLARQDSWLDAGQIIRRLEALEAGDPADASEPAAPRPQPTAPAPAGPRPVPAPAEAPRPAAGPSEEHAPQGTARQSVMARISSERAAVAEALRDATVVTRWAEDGGLTVLTRGASVSAAAVLGDPHNRSAIEQAVDEASPGAAVSWDAETAAEAQGEDLDPSVREALDLFGGYVVE